MRRSATPMGAMESPSLGRPASPLLRGIRRIGGTGGTGTAGEQERSEASEVFCSALAVRVNFLSNSATYSPGIKRVLGSLEAYLRLVVAMASNAEDCILHLLDASLALPAMFVHSPSYHLYQQALPPAMRNACGKPRHTHYIEIAPRSDEIDGAMHRRCVIASLCRRPCRPSIRAEETHALARRRHPCPVSTLHRRLT